MTSSLLASPTKACDSTLVKTCDVFGSNDVFATPTTCSRQQAVVSGNNAQRTGVKTTFLCPGDVEVQLGQVNLKQCCSYILYSQFSLTADLAVYWPYSCRVVLTCCLFNLYQRYCFLLFSCLL